jgi:sec-independent protein translocase protein TatA
MMPGPTELIIILVIVVLIFGAKRIPEIMGGIGKGIKSFKRSMEYEEPPLSAPPQNESTEPPPKENQPK